MHWSSALVLKAKLRASHAAALQLGAVQRKKRECLTNSQRRWA